MKSSLLPFIAFLILIVLAPTTATAEPTEPIDFAHDVLPLLKEHCAKCHTNGTYKGGLSMDSRAKLIESESVIVGKSGKSEFIERIQSDDLDLRMPKSAGAKEPVAKMKAADIAVLTRWIDEGLPWEEGFSFKAKSYKARLAPRRPELPPAVEGRNHPVDRIVDAYFATSETKRTARSDDARFVRRVTLDLTGQLPSPGLLTSFLADKSPRKRDRLVQLLLADPVPYADHWITFWNDLLRNDYQGTGFIDGGRKQITSWLYDSLVTNKPYDQFVRELISPTAESEGFIKGIKWRGRVNASQVPELQFAQNVSQVMLGINLKCASCHDSFINDWKLADAYGMAAIISDKELEIHRCDKPTGEFAKPSFVFPELGAINTELPREERLAELAELITDEKNGRLSRTIVNRLWHRLMGRGIVHPVDIMSNPPWSEDLLDYLAVDLVDHGYDLKRTIGHIVTSEIYQANTVPAEPNIPDEEYQFRGPVARRLTAEQFQDAVWDIAGGRPKNPDKHIGFRGTRKVRASIVPSNMLTRSLGRPNREQVVTTRPAELTTLPALDLTNGDLLASQLEKATRQMIDALPHADSAESEANEDKIKIVKELYMKSLSRDPNEAELAASEELLAGDLTAEKLADLYWAVLMLPEFQMVR